MTLPFWIALAIFVAVVAFLVWWLRAWKPAPEPEHLPYYFSGCMCHVCQSVLKEIVEPPDPYVLTGKARER